MKSKITVEQTPKKEPALQWESLDIGTHFVEVRGVGPCVANRCFGSKVTLLGLEKPTERFWLGRDIDGNQLPELLAVLDVEVRVTNKQTI